MVGRHKNSRHAPKGTGKPDPTKDRAKHESARGQGRNRRASAASLSANLSRREPTDEELAASLAEFDSGHDRVAAIMGAAMVEANLVSAIQICLDDSSDKAALFYDDKAPFATFYSRIVAAKAFGLISKKQADQLHIIRDIRNQFAHALICLDFDNELIARRCDQLPRFPEWDEGRPVTPRLRYQHSCYAFTVHLLKVGNQRAEAVLAKLTEKVASLRQPSALAGTANLTLGDLVSASLQTSQDNPQIVE
jgi:mannitol operon repressor